MAGNIYQDIDPVLLTNVARLMIADEDRAVNQPTLVPWFPSAEVDGIEWEAPTGTTRQYTEAAPYRTWDTPAPLGTRPGRGFAKGKLAPISMKFHLGELDQIRIRQMVAQGAKFADVVAGDILDDVGNGVRSLLNRTDLAAAELVRTGKLVLAERGVSLEYDAERAADRIQAAATPWTNIAATAFADERAAMAKLRAYGLGWNDLVVLTNQDTFDTYSLLTEVIESYQSNRILPRLSEAQVIQVRAEQRLPEVRVIDTMKTPYGGTPEKLIPEGQWWYVPKTPVGRTQYGPTVAAISGKVDLQPAGVPGVAAYMMDSEDPITLTTVVDATTIPTFTEPDATLALAAYPTP